jgi:NADH dehydrogenase
MFCALPCTNAMKLDLKKTISFLPNIWCHKKFRIITTVMQLMLLMPSLSSSFFLQSVSYSNKNYRYKMLQASANSNYEIMEKPFQVCILGGGFGGVNTALTLESLYNAASDSGGVRKLQITLIDPKERFVFLPLLYELCVGDASLDEVAPTYSSLFCTATHYPSSKDEDVTNSLVQWKQGSAIGVDVKNSCVFYNTTSSYASAVTIDKIHYDALVVCTGLDATPPISIPGAQQWARTFYTLDDCYALRKQLNNILLSSEQHHIIIVGAGYSGVELALNIRAFLKKHKRDGDIKVTLIHRGDKIIPNASAFNRDVALKRLKESNVDVQLETSVLNVTQSLSSDELIQQHSCDVVLAKKGKGEGGEVDIRTITTTLLLWTAGATPPKKGALNSILSRDNSGRILTGPTLQALGLHNVFALGDCAKVVVKEESKSSSTTLSYPATAQVAMQQASVVAWNAYEVLINDNKKRAGLLPFRYTDLGEMMTLGTSDATISSLGGLFRTSGKGASAIRRLVYASVLQLARIASDVDQSLR